ncbi:general secretion pathway protein K [Pseudoalteromonas citrea]|uniref:General secretion pathway protein K n=2 Tax=Pseudoalteromonas citrea TaxID=43655 RepID=A0AAD4FU42_9GAMM|nr:type II secretion system protein GspK [Pseudoalteromonas citrea]KAF7775484.1 general secretion pathway protein K [Pseudoalteromonas citrea]
MTNNSRGIALIQVLIITAVLMLLAIFIQQSIKQQIQVVSSINEKLSLRLVLENAEAEVFKALLSSNRYQDTTSSNPVVRNWNFYGKPFSVDITTVKLQDVSGLINLNYINRTFLERFLALEIDEPKRTTQLIDAILDWKDADDLRRLNGAEKSDYKEGIIPSNDYMQHVKELDAILEHVNVRFKSERVYNELTVERLAGFNPLNAPSRVLAAFLQDESRLTQVIAARNNGGLNRFRFFELTGIEQDEYVTFGTSRYLRLELRASKNGVVLTKQIELKVSPRTRDTPIIISKIAWY